ncbi:MAG: flagellar biosynthesis protein FlhF [Hylemonella sp.]|nr:flagellar biosynthesis protein FlhF [Hylemonella sp.]
MNIQRFYAPTSREALAKARMTFGENTLILSNRATPEGVEVVAAAEHALDALLPAQARSAAPPAAPPRAAAASRKPATAPIARHAVEEDADELAMSTLSFQDYVRERMLRRRHEELNPRPQAAATRAPVAPRATPVPSAPPASPAPVARPPSAAAVAPPAAAPIRVAAAAPTQGIVKELNAMKAMIEERFSTLSWLGQTRQHPIKSHLMLKLIRSGFSPALSRTIMEKLPDAASPAEAMRWVMDVLERNIKTDIARRPLYEEGGIYALVGATGVGKTTTAAKLASLCSRVHGPESVGLITLDTYRIGAHEQLRAYGRMIGVVAHQAHDRAALQDLLRLLSGKKMILVDTTGFSPRDTRKHELLEALDLPQIRRLLVLNAAGQGDTMDEVVRAFRTAGEQQAILSKVDEASKLGPALDTVIRNHLVLRGVANGQRVPEDWARAHSGELVRQSMRSSGKSAFDPVPSDLDYFFAPQQTPERRHDA